MQTIQGKESLFYLFCPWKYKRFGRNPKCDHDWIKIQREKGKIKKKGKRETKVQREKGKQKSKEKRKIKVKNKLDK